MDFLKRVLSLFKKTDFNKIQTYQEKTAGDIPAEYKNIDDAKQGAGRLSCEQNYSQGYKHFLVMDKSVWRALLYWTYADEIYCIMFFICLILLFGAIRK